MEQLELGLPVAKPEPLPRWSPADDYRKGLRPEDYDRGHPWFYYLGGIPLPCESIESHQPDNPEFYGHALQYRKRGKRKLSDVMAEVRKDLREDQDQYNDLVQRGHAALTGIIYSNRKLELATALCAKHNHIAYNKGLLRYVSSKAGLNQPTEKRKTRT